jgi:hypothetical protein
MYIREVDRDIIMQETAELERSNCMECSKTPYILWKSAVGDCPTLRGVCADRRHAAHEGCAELRAGSTRGGAGWGHTHTAVRHVSPILTAVDESLNAHAAALCSAIIISVCHTRVGPQTMRTELGAKQHWTRDFRAGIITRDNNPCLRGTPWR